ncbi:MAG TPA: OPT family oligopeptide transporter [Polyangiaceae bacterium]|nr:OPT family oligopeptide transporter [Polyangiaceae bacterium]
MSIPDPPAEAPPANVGATPEEVADREARRWLKDVYRGDRVPQLTLRSVITGMGLGGVMALSNLYVGFKTGWSLGVTITACILAYAIFSGLSVVVPRLREKEFTILENNMMSSVASAAGYMSSIFVSAVPALYLATQHTLGWLELSLWAGAVSFLGVFMAIPMKRQQINVEQLPFPSGIATAETLTAMHSRDGDAQQKAWALSLSAGVGALVAWFREAHAKWMPFNLPSNPIMPAWTIAGQPFSRLTLGFEPSLIMIGAGAIMGIRAGVSLLISALVCYAVVGPSVLNHGWVDLAFYRQRWALWPGVGLLVASGLTSFSWRWRTIVRAFASLGKLLAGQSGEENDPLKDVEAPQSWFLWGSLASGTACVLLGAIYFEISWWMGVLAVVSTFFLALVASRATGETDITPTGAMGKITQLVYGVLAPANTTTNLMTASITSGAAIHAADLLTDLKSGYLLGANPRKQLIAQLWGVVAGTLFVVPAYLLLIKPEDIGSDQWPAPAAQIWAGVAKVLASGLGALPAGAREGGLIGGVAGIALATVEELVPADKKKFTLSAAAVGIAWVVPAWNSISMFLGALIAWIYLRADKSKAERYSMATASGLIAGESLVAVLIAALVALKVLSPG